MTSSIEIATEERARALLRLFLPTFLNAIPKMRIATLL